MSDKINRAQKVSVVIYARAARQGTGHLNAQVSRLRAFAAQKGWTELVVITECRGSGMSEQVLRAITNFDVLLVEEFDRLGRRVSGLADILEALSETGTQVATPAWGPSVEPMPFGVLLFMAVAAQGARDDVSRRTRAGIAASRARRSGRQ